MRWISLLLLTCMLTGCAGQTSDHLTARQDRIMASQRLLAINEARQIARENISHADVVGYKRRTAQIDADGTIRIQTDMEQGSLNNTGRQFDLAISGNGFFRLRTRSVAGEKICYTRNGNFFINQKNQLVRSINGGMLLLDPEILIPAHSVECQVSSDGVVTVKLPDQNEMKTVGKIQLFQFSAPEQLIATGTTTFSPSQASGEAVESNPGEKGTGLIVQSCLETSNVDVETETQRVEFLNHWREAILFTER